MSMGKGGGSGGGGGGGQYTPPPPFGGGFQPWRPGQYSPQQDMYGSFNRVMQPMPGYFSQFGIPGAGGYYEPPQATDANTTTGSTDTGTTGTPTEYGDLPVNQSDQGEGPGYGFSPQHYSSYAPVPQQQYYGAAPRVSMPILDYASGGYNPFGGGQWGRGGYYR